MRPFTAAAACALVVAVVVGAFGGPALAEKGRHELLRWKLADRWWLAVPLAAEAASGWFDGVRSRQVRGAAFDLEAAAGPELRYLKDRFRVRLEASHRRRETVGASVPEATTLGRLTISGRPVRALTLEGLGGVRLTQRPGWPDLYQPLLDDAGERTGDLASTDRYGFRDLDGRIGARWQASRAFSVAVRAAVQERTYAHDPAYDDLVRPTHVVPADRLRVRGALLARAAAAWWRGTLNFDVDWLAYRFLFARDAGTGLTHSPPGGDPANPLQRFVRAAFLHRSRVRLPWLGAWAEAGLGYGRNQDLHDGYYTWDALEARASAGLRPLKRLRLVLDWSGTFRWYGDDGYQPGPTHPALDDGARRREHRSEARARLAWDVWRRRVTPFLEASWIHRTTNFPDYEPWTNPPGYPYAIDFDYDNVAVRAGVRVEL